jgi:glycosyltransferase involved in cell wall biosynthesis
VLFLGLLYAGHKTRYLNLRSHTESDPRIYPIYREVTGWKNHGFFERLTPFPESIRGRARAVVQARHLARFPRPDAIWTGVSEVLPPYLWAQAGPLRRPLVLDMDWTLDQGEAMAQDYFGRPPKSGFRRFIARAQERAVWRVTSIFTPWSNWAADGLRRAGIPGERIRVLPPGVSLELWRPHPEMRQVFERPLRILFVGADFKRKGGDMLVEAVRSRFGHQCELHIVTRDAIEAGGNVFLHRAEPNTPELQEQYAKADLFCLPTRAEAFGIAAIEALASGLPVILGNVGGTPDIVDHGSTGWLIKPTLDDLIGVLELALEQREQLPAMGMRARVAAEQRFDATRNAHRVVDALLEAIELGHRVPAAHSTS